MATSSPDPSIHLPSAGHCGNSYALANPCLWHWLQPLQWSKSYSPCCRLWGLVLWSLSFLCAHPARFLYSAPGMSNSLVISRWVIDLSYFSARIFILMWFTQDPPWSISISLRFSCYLVQSDNLPFPPCSYSSHRVLHLLSQHIHKILSTFVFLSMHFLFKVLYLVASCFCLFCSLLSLQYLNSI